MSEALRSTVEKITLPHFLALEKMTMTQKVAFLHELAGKPANRGWEAVDNQMEFVSREYQEFLDTIAARDPNEMRRELCDLLVCLLGVAHRAGFDLEQDFNEVIHSNLTKFDASEAEAQRTIDTYAEINVSAVVHKSDVQLNPDAHACTLYLAITDRESLSDDGKTYPAGRWLKSPRFIKPSMGLLPILVQEQLGLVKINRDSPKVAFGTMVAQTPEGMIVRALDDYDQEDGTWKAGDLLLTQALVSR